MRAKSLVWGMGLLLAIVLGSFRDGAANPVLPEGVWTKITPAEVTMTAENHVFCQGMAIDPAHPSTLYLCVCAYDVAKGGLYKTTDGGAHWAKVGNLDEPIHIAIDPHDSRHLYCVDGVRGETPGFWVSRDGGNTWTMPAGFVTATQKPVGTRDLYSLAVDPTDFKHVLVSFHSPWSDSNNCGILESQDGGETWSVHNPPEGSARGYGMAVFFLYNPATKQGDKNTWLFTTQAGGFYRTTDAGATWTQAYKLQMTHGGEQLYRTKAGVLYAGAYQYPVRSMDNGASWEPLKKGLVYSWYMGICGDGKNLYTACSNKDEPFFTSPEEDGVNWTPYRGGTQKFSSEPFEMYFDSKNRILYAASWHEGLLALKVPK
jgi:photosystem II stability/assembly factor-like uncharacterized protein